MEKITILTYCTRKGKGTYQGQDGKHRSFRHHQIIKRPAPGTLANLMKDGSIIEAPAWWERVRNFFRRNK